MEGLSKIPPLYHYTSQAGLIGINQNKSLWFSHINFLNDSEEFYYSLDQIKKVIKEEYGEKAFADLSDIIPKRNEVYPVFILSLSERKDSLSQWRGYCPNGGYSVSFKEEYLTQLKKKHNLIIEKCLYKKEDQRKFIIENIGKIVNEYVREKNIQKAGGIFEKGMLPLVFLDRVLKYAPFIKHPKFKDEKEWRVVINYNRVKNPDFNDPSTHYQSEENKSYLEKLKFREGKSGIVPFLVLGLEDNNFHSKAEDSFQKIFNEIVIGPTPHKDLSFNACRMMVRDDSLQISHSKIPFRNW